MNMRSVRRRLKVNHSLPLSIRLNYCYGMLRLVILFLSRDRERLQITHPKQTSQSEPLHPAKEKSPARFVIFHPVLCPCHSVLRQREAISLQGCNAFSSLPPKEQGLFLPHTQPKTALGDCS